MAGPRTEEASDRYRGIDTWPSVDILAAIAAAQREAIDAVAAAVPAWPRPARRSRSGCAAAAASSMPAPAHPACWRRSTRSNCPAHMASPPTACRC